MDIHKHVGTTLRDRAWFVHQFKSGQTAKDFAMVAGVCPGTIRKWLARFRVEGPTGLSDRSSRPHRPRHPTPATVIEQFEALRRQRRIGKEIARPAVGSGNA